MIKPVKKAVFPVAGLGTRLLPATKTMPKEMLTVVDRPLIQYAVDEAREAGIEQLIFVTGRGKATLDDYFDIGFELETTMRERGKSVDALDCSRTGLVSTASMIPGVPSAKPCRPAEEAMTILVSARPSAARMCWANASPETPGII